ncbi:hypothetical protein [Verrucosispora sp. WMMD573]|uniref:hypothetical protein n=1 Tax=Verrucosispora sp. WMMD573 TaxID=3015149 RepID=UPI00248CC22E|nr:hypothetical protein [Verrucosispora sp. WMMD573]WBB52373.1 hypothetical protein O7601_17430 [Verrucosispora sp. WMMD573]
MDLMRRGWPIIVTAMLVFGASLLPWFRTRWADGDGWATNSATAWASSTWWAVAVTACLLAAAAGLLGLHLASGAMLRWGAAGLATTAVAVTAVTWLRIPPLTEGTGMAWSAAGAESPGVGDIVRDGLVLVRIDGLTHEVGWGVHAGLAAMVMLTAVLIIKAVRPGRPRSDARRLEVMHRSP